MWNYSTCRGLSTSLSNNVTEPFLASLHFFFRHSKVVLELQKCESLYPVLSAPTPPGSLLPQTRAWTNLSLPRSLETGHLQKVAGVCGVCSGAGGRKARGCWPPSESSYPARRVSPVVSLSCRQTPGAWLASGQISSAFGMLSKTLFSRSLVSSPGVRARSGGNVSSFPSWSFIFSNFSVSVHSGRSSRPFLGLGWSPTTEAPALRRQGRKAPMR